MEKRVAHLPRLQSFAWALLDVGLKFDNVGRRQADRYYQALQ
jgi:hypothetical protein